MTEPHDPNHHRNHDRSQSADDQRLADLVSDAVSDVEPTNRLDAIRARTRNGSKVTSMSSRRPWLYAAGGAVATAAVITAIAAAGGALPGLSADDEPTPGDRPSQHASDDPRPTQEASSSPEPSAGASADPTTVPAYFVGDTPQGPRLFREFRQVDGADPLGAAAALVTSGDTVDPDYRTLLPGGEIESISHEDDTFVVELSDNGWTTRAPGMSEAEAELAVQQLVYTLQGVAQARDPITFRVDGQPSPIFGLDATDGIGNAKPLDVLGLVSVTTPEQGGSATDTLRASGVASSFEANVPWEIRQGDQVVTKGFATAAGWMDKLYPWETEIDVSGLAPGEYTFVAMTDDPSGGEGGGPTEDSKDFTVG